MTTDRSSSFIYIEWGVNYQLDRLELLQKKNCGSFLVKVLNGIGKKGKKEGRKENLQTLRNLS